MPIVDVSFPLIAESIPRDHGYAVYAAISRAIPALHEARWLGVHPVGGTPISEDALSARRSQLRLRLPAERIVEVLPLAGSGLDVSGSACRLGVPTVHPLVPAVSLDARMVAIKLTSAPHHENAELGRETLDVKAFAARYREEIARQLAELDIAKPFDLRGKRSLTVAGRRILGFSVRVGQLSADESLRLMEHGLGGKRRMGCGLFRPTRGA